MEGSELPSHCFAAAAKNEGKKEEGKGILGGLKRREVEENEA